MAIGKTGGSNPPISTTTRARPGPICRVPVVVRDVVFLEPGLEVGLSPRWATARVFLDPYRRILLPALLFFVYSIEE